MVKYYKSLGAEKYIATNSISCVVITEGFGLLGVNIYTKPYSKSDSETLSEIDQDTFLDMYDKANANLIDFVGYRRKGLKALLPEAQGKITNH